MTLSHTDRNFPRQPNSHSRRDIPEVFQSPAHSGGKCSGAQCLHQRTTVHIQRRGSPDSAAVADQSIKKDEKCGLFVFSVKRIIAHFRSLPHKKGDKCNNATSKKTDSPRQRPLGTPLFYLPARKAVGKASNHLSWCAPDKQERLPCCLARKPVRRSVMAPPRRRLRRSS